MTYGKPPIIFSVPIKQARRALQGETESLLSQVPGKLWGKSSKDSVNNTSNPIEMTINKTEEPNTKQSPLGQNILGNQPYRI